LAQALGKDLKALRKKDSIDLDRSGSFAWNRCELVSGDISALDSSALSVLVCDEESEFNNESVTIDAELMKPDKQNGTTKVVMANEWAAAEVSGDSTLGLPPDDLITLTHLHEPSVVYCLRRRYEQDLIYTATGPILIALNPFKALPELYDDVMMNEYWMAGEELANLQLKPHIYQNAHMAFRSMMQGIAMQQSGVKDAVSNQSMLVSGESGAGKTVTTKHVMKYLATLSQRKAKWGNRRRASSPGRSELRVARRSSTMRASRAMSWKVGALVEERSAY
jgi:myosin heavy subunit